MASDTFSPVGILIVLGVLAFLAGMIGLLVWSLVWVYRDANVRGKSGWLVALLCFMFNWPFSILMWIVFRPEFDKLPLDGPANL
jgi:hypothetical protein